MQTGVFRSGPAIAISEEAGYRIATTALKFGSENVGRHTGIKPRGDEIDNWQVRSHSICPTHQRRRDVDAMAEIALTKTRDEKTCHSLLADSCRTGTRVVSQRDSYSREAVRRGVICAAPHLMCSEKFTINNQGVTANPQWTNPASRSRDRAFIQVYQDFVCGVYGKQGAWAVG